MKEPFAPKVEDNHLGTYEKIPQGPGIYKFYDESGTLIYIGKAKNMRKRVCSYFRSDRAHNYKTKKMVAETASFSFFRVGHEQDALFLERNLIRKHQPKYNILLKDDKSYPYLCLTKERFPRLLITRKRKEEVGYYYGPHARVHGLRAMLRDIRKAYKIRTCRLVLSEKAVGAGKYKVCLEYHLGNCSGPCEGLQAEEEYQQNVREVEGIIKGDLSTVKRDYEDKIAHYAKALHFEKAQQYKEKLEGLKDFQSKSLVASPKSGSLNFFAWVADGDGTWYVHYLRVERGMLLVSENMKIENVLGEKKEALMPLVIVHLTEKHKVVVREIISNEAILPWSEGIKTHVPTRGDKRKLLNLAVKNAFLFKEKSRRRQRHDTLLVKKALGLREDPEHIECFDVSNAQERSMVAAVVCFREGSPSKKDYRRMRIRTVKQQDDYACMREAVYRRYHRAKVEGGKLPDLIVIDGGKGHLSAALEALRRVQLEKEVPVISLAKKLEEIYTPKKDMPIRLRKDDPALHALQCIRDEAHRFAVGYLRKERTRKALSSALERIDGVGKESAKKLLRIFSSREEIEAAGEEHLTKIVGKRRGRLVKAALANKG